MTDAPTGTNAGRHARRETDRDLAVAGGQKYTARLQEIEAASKKLNIGNDAAAALSRAQRKLDEADSAAHAVRNQAAMVLADAHTKAEALIARANEILANAQARQHAADDRLKQVEAQVRVVFEVHADAARAHAEADQLRDEMQGKLSHLSSRLHEIAAA